MSIRFEDKASLDSHGNFGGHIEFISDHKLSSITFVILFDYILNKHYR